MRRSEIMVLRSEVMALQRQVLSRQRFPAARDHSVPATVPPGADEAWRGAHDLLLQPLIAHAARRRLVLAFSSPRNTWTAVFPGPRRPARPPGTRQSHEV